MCYQQYVSPWMWLMSRFICAYWCLLGLDRCCWSCWTGKCDCCGWRTRPLWGGWINRDGFHCKDSTGATFGCARFITGIKLHPSSVFNVHSSAVPVSPYQKIYRQNHHIQEQRIYGQYYSTGRCTFLSQVLRRRRPWRSEGWEILFWMLGFPQVQIGG